MASTVKELLPSLRAYADLEVGDLFRFQNVENEIFLRVKQVNDGVGGYVSLASGKFWVFTGDGKETKVRTVRAVEIWRE